MKDDGLTDVAGEELARGPRVSGPGALPVRAAVAAIRRLAAQPPPSESFGGWLGTSRLPNGTRDQATVRRIITPAHLVDPDSLSPLPSADRAAVAGFTAAREAIADLERTLDAATQKRGGRPETPGAAAKRLYARHAARAALARSVEALAAHDGVAASEAVGVDEDADHSEAAERNPALATQHDATEADLLTRALTLLGGPVRSPLYGGPIVPGSAFHDFAEYQFVRDPWSSIGQGAPSVPLPSLELFLARAHEIITQGVWAYCQMDRDTGPYTSISYTPYFPGFIDTIYRLFLRFLAEDLYELQAALITPYRNSTGNRMEDVLSAFDRWLADLCNNTAFNPASIASSFDEPARWQNASREVVELFEKMYPTAQPSSFLPEPDPGQYAFLPYPGGVNFGLRVVYRQEWLPLGNQPGEIVRTVPLGPKQSEKISIKVVRTTKDVRSSEDITSTETTTDSSTATKDSSEVVEQASSSFKWHVDAEASGGFGPVTAKLSAGAGGEQGSQSKDTKSNLTETMSKTASRMKRDTKIIVSTETTVTDESTRVSEITNPNDEIAVTYVYSKLQRAYELTTRLAEVNSVVFVPQPVLPPQDVTTGWVQRHATVIAKVLLDQAFAPELAAVVAEPDDVTLPDDGGVFKKAAEAANAATGEYKVFTGGYMPDLLASGQEAYARQLEAQRAESADKQRRKHRRGGLLAHIRRHILHYLRAVWADEDSDQRWLRYSRIMVPTRWVFVPDGVPRDGYEVNGRFVADYTAESLRPLTEIINPAGPIGYTGNYAVFLLRGSARLANMHEALAALRAGYARFAVTVTTPPHLVCLDSVAYEPRYPFATYELQYDGSTWTARVSAVGQQACDLPVQVRTVEHGLDLDGLRVWLDGTPQPHDMVRIVMQVTGELADPELRLLKLTDPLPPLAQQPGFFSAGLLEEMARYVPVVAVALAAQWSWKLLDDEQQQVVRENYHRFLMTRGATRRTVLDTNNLVVDLDVGDTPALEDFKRLHRYLDVLKELEERHRRRLENQRLGERLGKGLLGDPDIERMTVVTGEGALGEGTLAALLGGDGDEDTKAARANAASNGAPKDGGP